MTWKDALVSTIKEILQTALISLGIFLAVYVFLVQPHRVQGISMEPSFENGELLLTEKLSYRISRIERGDVIVFEAPVEQKVDFIKRVIGLPGDNVQIKNESVYINDDKLDEPYITKPTEGNASVTLGSDDIFVLGDNRTASSDSRSFGPIKKNTIRGKVWFVYWPFFKGGGFEGARVLHGADYSIPD